MRILIIIFLALSLHACKDSESVKSIPDAQRLLLIANEGNFGWGDGSLTIYDPEGKIESNEVYKQRNNESIGNVFQSILEYDNRYFFVINNSSKIIVTDTSYRKIGEITGFNSPRYIYPIKDDKQYL